MFLIEKAGTFGEEGFGLDPVVFQTVMAMNKQSEMWDCMISNGGG